MLESQRVEEYRHLVQILLPLYTKDGAEQDRSLYSKTRAELTERFGGLTAHVRAPARGLWKTDDGDIERDDIVIFEVLADSLEREWWQRYRMTLEKRFAQDAVIVRAMRVEMI